jgi:SAM-dependent methyltransferase
MSNTEKLRRRFYAESKSPFERFSQEAIGMVNSDSVVLHGGCGADSSIGFRTAAQAVIGVDLDRWICQNSDLDLALIGSLYHLPLPNQCVDIVAARWVLEHMAHPALFFHEVARVLRPCGHLVLLTTNQSHYLALTVRITPLRFQRWFISNVLGGDPNEVFPTFYRANSPRRVRSLAADAGLAEERLYMLEGAPSILKFSSISYLAGVAYERAVNRFDSLDRFRAAIVAIFSKLE